MSFWRGKRVFVTGHTGFKGAWMCAALHQFGAEVYGYALAPEETSLFAAADGARWLAHCTYADVEDYPSLSKAMAECRPEIVFHLAAQPLVRMSYSDPIRTYATNVMGTVHFLEAARHLPEIKAAVVISSDKCYENKEWPWGYRESEPMGGHDPYSSSKGCAELVASAYRNSFFYHEDSLRIATGRAGNVMGGGDWAADRLVPDLVRSICAGRPAVIRYPHAIRPFQHVLEPIGAYLKLAECLFSPFGRRFAQGWNFGPGPDGERTVSEVANQICKSWGSGAHWQIKPEASLHEAQILRLDTTKARIELQWIPTLTFEQVVDLTVQWYKRQASGAPAHKLTEAQVEFYFSQAGRAEALRK
jgi:CDP-glucose 4,6-dehydratase